MAAIPLVARPFRLTAPSSVGSLVSSATKSATRLWWQPLQLKYPTLLGAALPAISLNLPGLLQELWDGILKAVPKQKTPHFRKRSRQLAGKALQDVVALCRCPVCNRAKRMHVLCEHCVRRMWHMWKREESTATKAQLEASKKEMDKEISESAPNLEDSSNSIQKK